jgi:hypothetical protein
LKNSKYWAGRTVRETFDQHWRECSETGCHLWQRSKNQSGYGQLNIGGRPMLAHRFAWQRAFGEIPQGAVIMHNCDNPACVRLDHLAIGTHAENVADMISKGRHNNAGGWRKRTPPRGRATVREMFDQCYVIDAESGCWNWRLALNEDGYGKVLRDGRKIGAHRFAWEREHGQPVPLGHVVRHTCDNPSCVNPAHLLIGTQQDNIRDMVRRGRQGTGRGERAGNSKLTEAAVRDIRRRASLGQTYTAIAQEYPISIAQTRNIAIGKSWAHVT